MGPTQINNKENILQRMEIWMVRGIAGISLLEKRDGEDIRRMRA